MPATAFAPASASPTAWSPRPPPRRARARVRLPPPRSGSSSGGGGGDEPTTTTPWVSPDWLTSLSRTVGRAGADDSGIPVASAKLDDVQDLLGGALFLPLFKWFREEGPVYRLAAGPRDFVIVSDPAVAKHVLRGYGSRYEKGLVAEVSEFLFGSGFATAEGALWTGFLKGPDSTALENFVIALCETQSCCAIPAQKISVHYGRKDSPVIDAVYTALKEAELRSTDLLPYWKIDFLCKIIPRQIKAENAVKIIRNTVEELIMKCKEIVEAENEQIEGEEYVNEGDPSILRFLLASRDEVSSVQLRDDLLSMLVAGHETTGSVLTWTIYLLSKDPTALRRAQDEVDRVLQGRLPRYEDVKELKYLMRLVDDVLPGNYKVKVGQDIMISVYNIHRSPEVWDRADEFIPERFDLEGPVPNESNTDFRFIPFSGGPRKCVGDQFALLEAIVALAIVLQKMDIQLVPDQKINMTTGATIHTTNGLYMNVSLRKVQQEAELALR
ncbi:Carotene epsilon-monooxygenase, chloroplastic [Dichanthelium oligosanthes]|uniref:Carotene epsilon-monooxygenase, chloroplastic n=1 Tax=Dichanthelium oligosanthes TaxID=888268 RepID=A0A1E5VDY8_9POAL|nr:Carotene epsilon-monooxygenase, chloroplastic [Dichanthelium oligosanthes]